MTEPTRDEILSRAIRLDPADRRAFLDEVCAGNDEARAELESLLGVYDRFPGRDHKAHATEHTPPDHIGRYPVLSVLGAGGMGRVYLARDPGLDREIAVKRMPARMFQRPEDLVRFRREAQILARLSHANIATVYTFEEDDAGPFITMEYVKGETLAARVSREGASFPARFEIGRDIAQALSAAHAAGIVHRDLKPANVCITPDGTAKVLDFGLAKAAHPGEGTSPTESGAILGTPGYMSPEQLRGRDVGPAADVWAFGCTMFECLAGRPSFPGDSAADRIAATLAQPPDWSLLPPDTPRSVRGLLERALSSAPEGRPDATELLDGFRAVDQRSSPPSPPAAARRAGRQARRLFGPVGLLALVAIGIFLASTSRRTSSIERYDTHQITRSGNVVAGAISPDGQYVAYATESGQLTYVDLEAGSEVSGQLDPPHDFFSPNVPNALTWSPDGSQLLVNAYFRPGSHERATFVLPRWSYRPRRVGPIGFVGCGWSPDGREIAGSIYPGGDSTLVAVVSLDDVSHQPRPAFRVAHQGNLADIDWSDRGRLLLHMPSGIGGLWVCSETGEDLRRLGPGRGWWAADGRSVILYTDDALQSQAVDDQGRAQGEPTIIVERAGDVLLGISDDASKVLFKRATVVSQHTWMADRVGSSFEWTKISEGTVAARHPRLSRDGTRAVFEEAWQSRGGESTIVQLDTASRSRIAFPIESRVRALALSPDGTEVAYARGGGLTILDFDSGASRRVGLQTSRSWLYWPHPRRLFAQTHATTYRNYIAIDSHAGSGELLTVDTTRGTLYQMAVSPSGTKVAVAGNRGDRPDVKTWVIDLADGSERLLYDGWSAPFQWTSDGWVYLVTDVLDGEPEVFTRVFRIEAATGAMEAVCELPGRLGSWHEVDVDDAGRRVVCTINQHKQDLWLIEKRQEPEA